MIVSIRHNDVFHVFRTLLDEIPTGVAALERDPGSGWSQLIPSRKEAARLYAIGDVNDCEIGIVEVTHGHHGGWEEAIQFCCTVVNEGSNTRFGVTVPTLSVLKGTTRMAPASLMSCQHWCTSPWMGSFRKCLSLNRMFECSLSYYKTFS